MLCEYWPVNGQTGQEGNIRGSSELLNGVEAGLKNCGSPHPALCHARHLQAVIDFLWNRESPLIQHCAQHFDS
jgi:hypothetical protein